jgi:hypothetical protein
MANEDVAALIRPGSILLLFCHFCTPPKPKFFVVMAIEPFALGFFINSLPTSLQQKLPHLMADLVKIARADYPRFLHHDSFVDCSQVIIEYEFEELVAAVAVDPAQKHKGSLTQPDALRIAAIVDASLNLEGSNRKVILKSFEKAGLQNAK